MTTTVLTLTPKQIPASSSTAADAFADTLTITTNISGDTPHNVQLHETAQGDLAPRTRQTGNAWPRDHFDASR